MFSIYLISILVLGIIIYGVGKQLIPCYWLILNSLFLPIVAFLDGAVSDEEIMIAYGKQSAILNILLFILIILELPKIRKLKQFVPAFLALAMLVFISLIWSIHHFSDNSVVEMLSQQKQYISVLLVPVYVCLVGSKLSYLKKTLILILLCEILIALVNQYLGFHLYVSHYLSEGLGYIGEYTSGTFKRFNNLTGFLSVTQAIISSEYLLMRRMSWKYFVVSSCFIAFIILLTGSRIGIFTFFVSTMIPALINYKMNKSYIILMVVLGCVLLVLVFSVSTMMTTSDAETGIERNLIGLSEKLNKKSAGAGETTDKMSSELIERYFDYHPLGRGLTANRDVEAAYGNAAYAIDARLAFIVVEYGWVYLLCVFLFYIAIYRCYTMRMSAKGKWAVFNVILILLLLSISDDGIFDKLLFTIWCLYAVYCAKLLRLFKNETVNISRN